MRNYKKELEWENNKYRRLVAKIDKDLAEQFIEKSDKPYATWLKEEIQKFLKNK